MGTACQLDKRVEEHLKKLKSTEQTDAEKKNIYKYLPKQLVKKERKRYLKFMEDCTTKPARKQVEVSLANNYSYKEGDEEFNFWYSKYITDKDEKEKVQPRQGATPKAISATPRLTSSKRAARTFACSSQGDAAPTASTVAFIIAFPPSKTASLSTIARISLEEHASRRTAKT